MLRVHRVVDIAARFRVCSASLCVIKSLDFIPHLLKLDVFGDEGDFNLRHLAVLTLSTVYVLDFYGDMRREV